MVRRAAVLVPLVVAVACGPAVPTTAQRAVPSASAALAAASPHTPPPPAASASDATAHAAPTTPTATPRATAAPVEPEGRVPRTISVTEDQVRITVTFDRLPMPAGARTDVVVEVRNLSREPLTWFHDGCATLVHVYGTMLDPWREGIRQEGMLARSSAA